MKSDIDRLMLEREFDAIIVTGGEEFNSARYYLSNGAQITHGTIFKLRDKPALLVCSRMELEEAAKSGLDVKTDVELGYHERYRDAEGDSIKATGLHWSDVLGVLGLSAGRVGLYGTWQINKTIALYRMLQAELPAYTFVVEEKATLIEEAMVTKDADEIARIRSVAERTNAVMELAWERISRLRPDGDYLLDEEGRRATIGDIKDLVRRELMARGLEDTNMIFAQGRDGGFPHSRGEADMPLRLGQTIVFDLFPRELGGGYHHDMTRTWCIGYAPSEVRADYDTVMEAFDIAVETFGMGKPTHLMQEAVLDHFESEGHATSRSEPATMEGYLHSLGHGVGIEIHEGPSISHLRRDDVFQIGNILTIEPGLYYPERGYGVRVEDMFVVDESGQLVSLSPFRKDLVIPLKSGDELGR
ncbi:MAG: Xaa-Pro peptidase family protein [Chloroflexi bacterium]|nr:Xaa-Pro peptidase family protein [Chloroflexota bacterium]